MLRKFARRFCLGGIQPNLFSRLSKIPSNPKGILTFSLVFRNVSISLGLLGILEGCPAPHAPPGTPPGTPPGPPRISPELPRNFPENPRFWAPRGPPPRDPPPGLGPPQGVGGGEVGTCVRVHTYTKVRISKISEFSSISGKTRGSLQEDRRKRIPNKSRIRMGKVTLNID